MSLINTQAIAEDHPRLRGEYPLNAVVAAFFAGSPPLARGILNGYHERSARLGITPACAGNTHIARTAGRTFEDHPRLRGEYL